MPQMKIRDSLGWLLVIGIVTIVLLFKWEPTFFSFTQLNKVKLNASQQYVIYECDGTFSCGGWADRQKGIVSSYVMSQMMGRKYRIRITSPCDLTTHLESNEIPWEIIGDELQGLSVKHIKRVDEQADKLRQEMASLDLVKRYPEDVIYFTSNMEYVDHLLNNSLYAYQNYWFHNMSVPVLYINVLRRLFKLKPPLQTRFVHFSKSIPRDEGVKLICAQVRLGKNPTVPKDTLVLNTLDSVSVVWEFLAEYNITSRYRIFVTSDSEDVRRTAKAKFPLTAVDMDGDIVHIERTLGTHVCAGFAKVILDQLILSTCDVLVFSRSGLGRISAWYRGRKDGVYCFAASHVKPCNPYDLNWFFPSW